MSFTFFSCDCRVLLTWRCRQATTLGGDSKPSSTPSVTGTGASGSKTTAASAAKGSSTSTSSSTGGAAPTGVAIAMLGMAMLPLLG